MKVLPRSAMHYCEECDNYDEHCKVCDDCERVYWCDRCYLVLEKESCILPVCEICQRRYDRAMDKYDRSVDNEYLGDREGDYDVYDNREDT